MCNAEDAKPKTWRYWLNDFPLVSGFNVRMSPIIADVLDVFAAIYLADRLAPRCVPHDSRPPEARGLRRIHLEIPLRSPDRWRAPEVMEALREIAFHVSEDDWCFRFVRRESTPRRAESQLCLFPGTTRYQSVATLHSGGMDSLLGLLTVLEEPGSESVTAVSVITHGRVMRLIEQISSDLSVGGLPKPLHRQWVEIHLCGQGRGQLSRESSQRTRGLLFLGAGAAAVVLAGNDRLQIMENGPGAINLAALPYRHRGYLANQATHPVTLERFGRLVSLVLNREFRVVNEGIWHTKAELVRSLYKDQFVDAFRHSVSCERFPYTTANVACGKCAGCLNRMIALHAAGLESLDEKRYLDLQGEELIDELGVAYCSPEGASLRVLSACLSAAFRTSADLTGSNFATDLLDIVHLASEFQMPASSVRAGLIRMLRTYGEEIASLLGSAGRVARLTAAPPQRLSRNALPIAS